MIALLWICTALWAQSPEKGTTAMGLNAWAGVGHSSAVYFATPYLGAYPLHRWFLGIKISVGQAAFRVGNDSYLTAGPMTRFYFFSSKITPMVQAGVEYGVSTLGAGAFTAPHLGAGASFAVKKDFALEIVAQYMYFNAKIGPDRRGLDAFMVGFGFQGWVKKKKTAQKKNDRR